MRLAAALALSLAFASPCPGASPEPPPPADSLATTSVRRDRVPRPEFDGGYRTPSTSTPLGSSGGRDAADLLVLVAALALASHLAIQRRSRRGLVALSGASVAYFGFFRGGCLCPIGSIQNVALALGDRSLALPLATAGVFVLPLAAAVWRGRVFCAGACPAGALQDLVLVRGIALPAWLSESLSIGRHVYLGAAVLFAATGSLFLVCAWDPFVSIFHLSGNLAGVGLGAAFVATSLFVARPYCRFLCPYGVLLGWCARLASRRATTCPSACVTCRLCEGSCPVGALRAPASGRAPESVEQGVRRLVRLLALAPVVIATFAWIGARLEVPLARMHPAVRLAEAITLEAGAPADAASLETRTFRSAGRAPAELLSEARGVRERFRLGGALLGAYLGLVLTGTLLRWSRRQRRPGFGPDPAACVACGRCFAACPQAQAPLTPLAEAPARA